MRSGRRHRCGCRARPRSREGRPDRVCRPSSSVTPTRSQVGDPVVAIGNALGLSEGSGATVTTGIISGLDRVVDVGQRGRLFNAIQTDAAINPGNSGGPLVDTNGQVIGINTAIASPETSNNVGFAISISSAKPVIEALRDGRAAADRVPRCDERTGDDRRTRRGARRRRRARSSPRSRRARRPTRRASSKAT